MIKTAENVAEGQRRREPRKSPMPGLARYEQYLMSHRERPRLPKGIHDSRWILRSPRRRPLCGRGRGHHAHAPPKAWPSSNPSSPAAALSFGAQTHPADGNAGIIVTTQEKAKELSVDKDITIQLLSYGYARARKKPAWPPRSPSAKMALDNAGITVGDLKAVKTHNPFTVNDIMMCRMMNIPRTSSITTARP
jgi:acetyl-CoA acyltransferase